MTSQENTEASNLLEGSDNVQDAQIKAATELRTEVTSIAQEEKRTGQKIEMPSQEELVARASSSLIVNQQRLNMIISQTNGGSKKTISRKGMNRVLNSIFSLPQEGQRVLLQGDAEKAAFAIGQNIIRDMFIIMANHAFEQAKLAKQEEALQNTETSDSVESKPNEGGQENV